jgi:hypothetical protein
VARIRTIKPEFWKHEDLSALPEPTHILAAALLNYADDFGYFNANPALVKAECSPLREPSVSIPESLRRLQEAGYIQLGTGDNGRRYGRVAHFQEHQRVSHPTKSKIADLSITWDALCNPPEKFRNPPETFAPEQGTGNREQGKEITGCKQPESNPADALRAVYPKRAGSHRWADAKSAINARLREGHTLEEICDGARRYAAFCVADGIVGTKFVMQAATFVGANKEFLNPWAPQKRQLSAIERVLKGETDDRVVN